MTVEGRRFTSFPVMSLVEKAREQISEEAPGWFERLGIRYFQKLSRADRTERTDIAAGDDESMVRAVRRVTLFGFLIAFLVGGISAGGAVAAELFFVGPEGCADYLSRSCLVGYGWTALITVVLTLGEFAVLFWISIRTVYSIARITGHNRLEEGDSAALRIPNLLSRAALEIPDPIRRVLGIDPLKRVSKKKMLAIGILYKLKVMLSNVLAKLFLRRVLGKSAFRVYAAYISVPVTGLWNGIVVYKVAREARLRLFGNLLARHIAEKDITPEKLRELSPRARLCCLQAVGNSIVLTQNYHPNMLFLLVRLLKIFDHAEDAPLDSWEEFLANLAQVSEKERYFILDLLAVAAAFDGRVSRLERENLGQAFQEHSEAYFQRIERLKNHMLAGRLYAAIEECRLDFEPG